MSITMKKIIQRTFLKYDHLKKRIQSKKLKNKNITIISNNCIGGFVYQDFGLKYNSPTIGLQFSQSDFVKFLKSFDKYLSKDIIEIKINDQVQKEFNILGGGNIDFPIGKLDDITIFFQHYKTFNEAIIKWEERKKRINFNQLFFVFIGYDNTPIEIFQEFNSLPYKNKILLTNSNREIPNAIALNFKNKLFYNRNDKLYPKKFYEKFNFYKWITKNINNK